MRTLFILFFSVMVLSACNNENKNEKQVEYQSLKKFYYPLEELKGDGLVYVYYNDSLGLVTDYWLYKTVKDDAGDLFLIAAGYNAIFEQQYFSRQWIVADGTILKDYQFMTTDSASGKSIITPAKIEDNVYFPYNPTQDSSKAYRFRMKFALPPDTALQYDLVRDRKFDKFLEYEYEGKKLPAAQFSSKEYINASDRINGGNFDIKSEIKEIYALGIGLVYIEKSGNGVNFKQRLKRRISPDEFINLQSDNK